MVIYNRSHINLSSLIFLHLSGVPATTAALIFMEVDCARGKLTFDGSIERISCVTEHPDYLALTDTTVLKQVAPLIRDKNGRTYRRRNGTSENE